MHHFLKTLWILILVLAVSPSLPLDGQSTEKQEGVLRIQADGQTVGTERYQIAHLGSQITAQADIQVEVAGTKYRQNTSLLLSPSYEPQSYEWRMEEPQEKSIRLRFNETRATLTFVDAEGKESLQEYTFGSTRVALLDVNVFHHFLLLLRLYDFRKDGPQTIQVFVPQSLQPGMVTVEAKGVETVQVGEKKVTARRVDVITEDNQVHLWLASDDRLIRLQVPSAGVTVEPESLP